MTEKAKRQSWNPEVLSQYVRNPRLSPIGVQFVDSQDRIYRIKEEELKGQPRRFVTETGKTIFYRDHKEDRVLTLGWAIAHLPLTTY